MDQNSHSKSSVPVEPTSPEEDAKLLAIEALEARTVDPDPAPLIVPEREVPAPAPVAPTPPAAPVVVAPVAPPEPVKVIESVIPTPPPAPVVVAPEPKPVVETPPAPVVVEKPAEPAKPKKPLTAAEEMAEELAHAPAMTPFQFFLKNRMTKAPIIIISIIIVLAGLGVAAYFVIH